MTKVVIDEIDRKILRYLVKNARMPFLEIARECGVSGAAIHQRVKKMDELGVILGSRLEVNPTSLGFDICALIGIRIAEPAKNANAIESIIRIPEIVECHHITGQFNLMVKIFCTDNEHLMRTIFEKILGIQGISYTETFISLQMAFSRQVHVELLE